MITALGKSLSPNLTALLLELRSPMTSGNGAMYLQVRLCTELVESSFAYSRLEGSAEYRVFRPSVEASGRQERGYDLNTTNFRGHDQRITGHASVLQDREAILRLCPSPSTSLYYQWKATMPDKPPATGRVYATTHDQATKTSGTITGNLYIDDRTAFVLFDTGATYSIISTTFAKKLNVTPNTIN
ncbi:reverse transcriptase domain-containing protein [Tanacetum coccineum]